MGFHDPNYECAEAIKNCALELIKKADNIASDLDKLLQIDISIKIAAGQIPEIDIVKTYLEQLGGK